jgi:uncharacterized protein (DUF488 family)
MQPLFTIGHSNHAIERFVELLATHNIAHVVDVRSFPSSRFSPQFNSAPLKEALAAKSISYSQAGQHLGGRSGHSYPELRQTASFRQALRELIVQSQSAPTAIMCAEEDPFTCHRRFLIARALQEDLAFLNIQHIRKDASLLEEPGFPQSAVQLSLASLFES